MKQQIWKNCSPLTHCAAVVKLHEYMATIGETKGRFANKIYGCKKYLVRIRQTKSSIIVEVL